MLEFPCRDFTDSKRANLLVAKGKNHIPESYKEGLATPERAKWIVACYEELMAIKNNDVLMKFH